MNLSLYSKKIKMNKMNWRNSIAILAFVLSTSTFAQSNLLNAKTLIKSKKTEAELSADNDKPLPYGYVHDRDILMGKRIWETYRS